MFGQPDELKRLTDIVWPEIRKLAEARINESKASDPQRVVVLEAAVLFEAGWDNVGDQVWVVVVDPEIAIDRAVARDSLDREAVKNRLDAQLSNAERTAKADVVIDNSGSEQQMIDHLKSVWREVTG